jgi:hypothetical protein
MYNHNIITLDVIKSIPTIQAGINLIKPTPTKDGENLFSIEFCLVSMQKLISFVQSMTISSAPTISTDFSMVLY